MTARTRLVSRAERVFSSPPSVDRQSRMERSPRQLVAFSLLTALFLLAGVGLYRCGETHPPSTKFAESAPDAGSETQSADGWGMESESSDDSKNAYSRRRAFFGTSALESFAALPNRNGPRIQFVDPMGRGEQVTTVIGAPGLWPSAQTLSDRKGRVRLPRPETTTLRGGDIRTYEVFARSSGRPRAFWQTISPESSAEVGDGSDTSSKISTYELGPAAPLKIRVVDTDAEPVTEADVSVGRGALGFLQVSSQSDESGVANFEAIPEGRFRIRVRKGDRRGHASIEHRVSEPGEPQDPVWVTLRSGEGGGADLPTPSEVASFGDERPQSSSERSDEQTGDAERETTDRESVSVDTTVRLTVDGISKETWRAGAFRWRVDDSTWQRARLQREETGRYGWNENVSGSTLSVELAVDGELERRATASFPLTSDTTRLNWAPHFSRRVSIYTVDGQGAPIRGAKIFVWRNGELSQTMVSGGTEARYIEVPASSSSSGSSTALKIGAVRGGVGETLASISTESNELTLRLNSEIYSSDWPGRLNNLERLESALQTELVELDGGVQFDPLQGGRADGMGIRAGTWLLHAHRSRGSEGVTLHTSAGGTHQVVDVSLDD